MDSKKGIFSKNDIIKNLTGEKGIKIIVTLGLVGVALIFLSDFIFPKKEEKTAQIEDTRIEYKADEYHEELEKKLTKILKNIEGLEDISVMVTLESTAEYIFASEEKSQSDSQQQYNESGIEKEQQKSQSENKYILVEGKTGKKDALVQTILEPRVRGVLIVCKGSDNPYIQQKILEAVSKLFDISTTQIYVTN